MRAVSETRRFTMAVVLSSGGMWGPGPLVVESSGVDYWGYVVVGAEDDEQVGDHGGTAFVVKFHDVVFF